jgi:hypothetical protein
MIIGRSRTALKCSMTLRAVRRVGTVRYVTKTRSQRCTMSVKTARKSVRTLRESNHEAALELLHARQLDIESLEALSCPVEAPAEIGGFELGE